MDADCALYAEVLTADELARLLPVRFQSVALAEQCLYARAADPRWPATRLFTLATQISATGRDTIVLEHDRARATFYFARFRCGKLERELRHDDGGRRSERGLPEPWELELVDFEPWSACELVGNRYRLTGWFDAAPVAAPAADDPTWLRCAAEPEVATTAVHIRRVATLVTSLERCTFGAAADRALFLAHSEFYVLVDVTGAPFVHTRVCKRHGEDRVIRVYTSAASVAGYLQSWEAPVLGLRTSAKLDGAEVLALAEAHRAGIMDFNIYGEGPGPELTSTSLAPTRCLWL